VTEILIEKFLTEQGVRTMTEQLEIIGRSLGIEPEELWEMVSAELIRRKKAVRP
jgi:hypothetical protein